MSAMRPEDNADPWRNRLRADLQASGKSIAEVGRRIGERDGALAAALAGRRKLGVGTALALLRELGQTPGLFCSRLYPLAGWRLDIGDRIDKPLLAELGQSVEGEPTWRELWQESLDREARREVDVRVELEALRKLLEVRIAGRRETEESLEAKTRLKNGTLEAFLSAERDLALVDLFRVLAVLEIAPATFFGDLYPAPGHEHSANDAALPSWTEVLALADRLLAALPKSDEGAAASPPSPPDDPTAPGSR